jgi:hypothetical protein
MLAGWHLPYSVRGGRVDRNRKLGAARPGTAEFRNALRLWPEKNPKSARILHARARGNVRQNEIARNAKSVADTGRKPVRFMYVSCMTDER